MTTQHLVIPNWTPEPLANGPHGHWSQRQKKLKDAQTIVWAHAKNAGLQPVLGRACVTITLVFPVKRRRDLDGLYSRIKGCLDGLVKGGWIADDSTDAIDLRVRAETRHGERATEITLQQEKQ